MASSIKRDEPLGVDVKAFRCGFAIRPTCSSFSIAEDNLGINTRINDDDSIVGQQFTCQCVNLSHFLVFNGIDKLLLLRNIHGLGASSGREGEVRSVRPEMAGQRLSTNRNSLWFWRERPMFHVSRQNK